MASDSTRFKNLASAQQRVLFSFNANIFVHLVVSNWVYFWRTCCVGSLQARRKLKHIRAAVNGEFCLKNVETMGGYSQRLVPFVLSEIRCSLNSINAQSKMQNLVVYLLWSNRIRGLMPCEQLNLHEILFAVGSYPAIQKTRVFSILIFWWPW